MASYSFSKTEQDAQQYRKNWAKIFGKYRGTVYLTPSEAEAIIVQYDPLLRISAVLPPKTRNLRISFQKAEHATDEMQIQTPRLLLSHLLHFKALSCGSTAPCICNFCWPHQHSLICTCEFCRQREAQRKSLTASIFYISSLQEDPQRILSYPWHFANVYDDGRICFGYQTPATNLRQACSNFWGSTFNNDFKKAQISNHTGCYNPRGGGPVHHRQGHFTHRVKHAGPCRRQIIHTCECTCPNKLLHAVKCKYRAGCGCSCTCDCCKGICNCICNCPCCRLSCNCGCRCNYNEEFGDFLQRQALNNAPMHHYDDGPTVLGKKYLSTRSSIDGIFFSYDPEIIKKISPEYHRQDASCTSPDSNKRTLVLGLVKAIPDNEWEVTFEDGQVDLFDQKEVGLA